jgi:5-methylcytosine-specific restriction protein A
MNNRGYGFDGVDEADIRREKAKARKLRQSRWWRLKISTGRCYYCSRPVKPSELTMDHIVPLVKGGRSMKDNLVPACKTCNTKKKTLLPMEWEEYMKNIKPFTE